MVLAITGCGENQNVADTSKLGANLEMTGNNATFGKSASNGAALAIKQVNVKGGVLRKQLTLVVADNKSEAANFMQRLIPRYHVNLKVTSQKG